MGGANSAADAGLFGKLPARGDFVRLGLPSGFVAAWDDWLQQALPHSRAALGGGWQDAWLEAPVWRFALAPGVCGPGAVLGLMLPSVDSAGRYFPLTFAAVWPPADWPPPKAAAMPDDGAAWLEACEAAGFAALEYDSGPEQVLALLPPAANVPSVSIPRSGARWWTAGAPRVAAADFTLPGLPAPAAFAMMLDEQAARPDIERLAQ